MLAQSYCWTLDDITKLSYMQVILLQAAASYNRKVLDARLEEAREKNSLSPSENLSDAYGGKQITQLTSDEIIGLASGHGGPAPKIIKTRKDTNGEQQESQGEGRD